jgi:hypothetical protein
VEQTRFRPGARRLKEVTMIRIETVELPLVPESATQKGL